MNTYPLIRTRLSNERLMTALLLVLMLYNLPGFIADPGRIPALLLLLAIGLLIDAITHFVIYKRPVCAVPAAVTALILYTLSPGAPFWAECAALGAALIVGKAIWGGTGKNLFNPAMLGLVLMTILFPMKYPAFEPSWYLLPAVLLSLPFLLFRPYAGLGMILGMTASLMVSGTLTAGTLLTNGVFFWGCLVITDPVTTTSKPAAGFIIGVLAGFIPPVIGAAAPGATASGATASGMPAVAMPLGILFTNLLSYLADRLNLGPGEKLKKRFSKSQKIKLTSEGPAYFDLTDQGTLGESGAALSCDEILARIEKNKVFGMGGAAFPTAVKIRAVLASDAPDKHLIVNAAECDPGLVHDKWLLRNRIDAINRGVEILMSCVPFKSVTAAAKDLDGLTFIAPVRMLKAGDFYPAGAEKILIRDVLKKDLSGVPAMSGILVLNVQTVCAVYEAVVTGRAADTRYVTVADLNRRTGTVVRVRLGASADEAARKVLPSAANIYAGGGIMNARLADDGAVIDEKTNFLAAGPVMPFREALCSQCDVCSVHCPASLQVREIARYIDDDQQDKAVHLRPENCIECALCSFVCLAGRDQARRVKIAKKYAAAKNSVANGQTVC